MKKILVLVAVLALVAALVVPMAVSADTALSGYVTAPTISMTAPGGINFGQFTFGVADQQGPTTGSVAVVPNSANNVFWTVKATDAAYGNGYLTTNGYGSGTAMHDPLWIMVDGANWNYANVNAPVSGSNSSTFGFYAKQTAEANYDAAATYYDTVVFSVAITSFN